MDYERMHNGSAQRSCTTVHKFILTPAPDCGFAVICELLVFIIGHCCWTLYLDIVFGHCNWILKLDIAIGHCNWTL